MKNWRNMPGPGDEATWGPVTHPSDPRSTSGFESEEKSYDDTINGEILGKRLTYQYTVEWDIDGVEVFLKVVSDMHGSDPGITVEEEQDVVDFLEEYENDLWMWENTGKRTGHLR